MIGPFGRERMAATLRQHCPQMTRRRCMDKNLASFQFSDEVNKIRVVMDIYSIPQLDEIKEEIMVELRLSHYWQVNIAIRFRLSKKATLQGV